jgi:hypothetical protein
MWAEKGTRPRVVRQQQFESAYIFGAVCPERDLGIGLILPYSDTESMIIHLKHISTSIQKGKHGKYRYMLTPLCFKF